MRIYTLFVPEMADPNPVHVGKLPSTGLVSAERQMANAERHHFDFQRALYVLDTPEIAGTG